MKFILRYILASIRKPKPFNNYKYNFKVGNTCGYLWVDNGKVMQDGYSEFPEVIATFPNTKKGNHTAMTFIMGMLCTAGNFPLTTTEKE